VYPLFVAGRLPPDPTVAQNAINGAWQAFLAESPSSISEFAAPEVAFDDSGGFLFSAAVTPLK
jgi:hypothetical protein